MKTELVQPINSYRKKMYDDAISALIEILDGDKQNWFAWFYLAMSYARSNRPENGYRIFQVIAAMCPDTVLRDAARDGAADLEYEIINGGREDGDMLMSA